MKELDITDNITRQRIERAMKALARRPELFKNRALLRGLKGYRIGRRPNIDAALFNVCLAIENKKTADGAIAELEKTISEEQEERRLEKAGAEYKKETREIKQIILEQGAISLYDLMIKTKRRDKETILAQAKEAGAKKVEMPALLAVLGKKRKKELIDELAVILGAKNIESVRLALMSPEYHQRVVRGLKGREQ